MVSGHRMEQPHLVFGPACCNVKPAPIRRLSQHADPFIRRRHHIGDNINYLSDNGPGGNKVFFNRKYTGNHFPDTYRRKLIDRRTPIRNTTVLQAKAQCSWSNVSRCLPGFWAFSSLSCFWPRARLLETRYFDMVAYWKRKIIMGKGVQGGEKYQYLYKCG